MDKVSLALQLILSLSILVVLHEMGHYLPAKWFKTRVEKFYLFFDPYFSLFKKQIGDTEWGIGWVPFGGYVKISGMIDESMDKEQMKLPPQPWEFRSKKAWQRLIIMIGGVTVNFILGILIFAGIIFYWGESYIKTADAKFGLAVDSLGMELGLQDGDRVISAGGVAIEKFNPRLVSKEIIINEAKEIVIERDGKEMTLPVPADLSAKISKYDNKGKELYYLRVPFGIDSVEAVGNAAKSGITKDMNIINVNGNDFEYQHELRKLLVPLRNGIAKMTLTTATDTIQKYVAVSHKATIGIRMQAAEKFITPSIEKFGLMTSFSKGASRAVNFLGDQLKAFGQIFSGKMKATESLGSVFSMAAMFDPEWDWAIFWAMTGSLSILLAFFNLLPIPALDGGYVVFLIWEVITGKVPSDKFMEVVNYIGFILLMCLMVFALGLDISRLF